MPTERAPVVVIALAVLNVLAYFVVENVDVSIGGVLVLSANTLALWLFGPTVEDSLGRVRFLAFVVAGGAVAAAAQLALDADDVAQAAMLGAIAATAGGHLMLFPRGRTLTVVIVPFLSGVVELP